MSDQNSYKSRSFPFSRAPPIMTPALPRISVLDQRSASLTTRPDWFAAIGDLHVAVGSKGIMFAVPCVDSYLFMDGETACIL